MVNTISTIQEMGETAPFVLVRMFLLQGLVLSFGLVVILMII